MSDGEEIELRLLLEAVFLKYGYDYREYAKGSIVRRIMRRLRLSGLENLSQMTRRLIYDPAFFEVLVRDLSIDVTEMFRDPSFFLALRREVVPLLKTYPSLDVWVAGCAAGQEAYSLAILLAEEGLYGRTRIYATDLNEAALRKAEKGTYPMRAMRQYAESYLAAGGRKDFSEYYTADHGGALMNRELGRNILFASHNLVTDRSFHQMHLVLCRNVFIYFNRQLQNRTLGLFHETLVHGGFLCLGRDESVAGSAFEREFAEVVGPERIYRKEGGAPPEDNRNAGRQSRPGGEGARSILRRPWNRKGELSG